ETVAWALRVARYPTRSGLPLVGVGPVPVGGPFPDVAGHVVEAVAVGGEGCHGSGAAEAVGGAVPVGKMPLPDVGPPLPPRRELVPPDIALPVQAAAGRELPLRLGRQALAGPASIGGGILPGDVDHRMPAAPDQAACGPFRMTPAGARHVPPPDVGIRQRHRRPGWGKDDRSGDQAPGGRAGELLRLWLSLRHGD